MVAVWILIGIVIGFIIGAVVVTIFDASRMFGTVVVVNSDEGPYMFLELDKQPGDMANKKFVCFRVKFKDPNSHD